MDFVVLSFVCGKASARDGAMDIGVLEIEIFGSLFSIVAPRCLNRGVLEIPTSSFVVTLTSVSVRCWEDF
jgi:hypothetical protein